MKTLIPSLSALIAVTALAVGPADSFVEYFESRNRMANYVLAPPPPDPNPSSHAPHFSIRLPDPSGYVRCQFCEGRKEVVLEEPNYGQLDGRIGGAKKKKLRCPLCNGAGGWKAFSDPIWRANEITRAFAEYCARHQSRGELMEGNAFVPRELSLTADKKSLKRVAQAFGKPCKKCNWSGILPCKKCNGHAVVKCTSKDCKNGWVVTKTTITNSHSGGGIRGGHGAFHSVGSHSRRTTKRETVTVTTCPECGGAALLRCPECGGERATICNKCSGLGTY